MDLKWLNEKSGFKKVDEEKKGTLTFLFSDKMNNDFKKRIRKWKTWIFTIENEGTAGG